MRCVLKMMDLHAVRDWYDINQPCTHSHLITPRAHARARGYVIGRGVYYIYIYMQGLFSIFQNTHFQTPISAQEGFSSNLIAFSIP